MSFRNRRCAIPASWSRFNDPENRSAKLLDSLKIRYRKVSLNSDLKQYRTLVIGRGALLEKGPLPNLNAVRDGLNVLVFEQPTRAMERLGFRIMSTGCGPCSRGMRRIRPERSDRRTLHDWRGEGTLLKPYLSYNQFFCPEWQWCGFRNTRVWRCRNRGVVANVQIEKPTVGNFTADSGWRFCPSVRSPDRIPGGQRPDRLLSGGGHGPDGNGTRGQSAGSQFAGLYWLGEASRLPQFCRDRRRAVPQLSRKAETERKTDSTDAADVILVGPGAKEYPNLSQKVAAGKRIVSFGLSAEEIRRILPGTNAVTVKAGASQLADLTAPEFRGISNLDSYFQHRLDYAAVDGKEMALVRIGKGSAVIVGVAPWMLDYEKLFRLRSSFRRRAFLMSQILRNAGIASESVLLERFASEPGKEPWKKSFYLQEPISETTPTAIITGKIQERNQR